MHQINVAQLHFFFCASKTSSLKKVTDTNWDLKLTSLLKLLPQKYKLASGVGEITDIQFNRDKSEFNKLVFTFTFNYTGKESNTYNLIITPCFVCSFTLSITGEDGKRDESIEKHVSAYFNIIFRFEEYSGIEQQ